MEQCLYSMQLQCIDSIQLYQTYGLFLPDSALSLSLCLFIANLFFSHLTIVDHVLSKSVVDTRNR